MHEPTGLDSGIRLHINQSLDGARRQYRIGVEKEQPFAGRQPSASVHLNGATFGIRDDLHRWK